MPRKRRITKRRHLAWSEAQERQLLTGYGWPLGGDPFFHTSNVTAAGMDLAREAWEELREELLANWQEQHPGTRPWAWWQFDAVERRLVVDGRVHPFDDPIRQAHVAKIATGLRGKLRTRYLADAVRLTKGVPACLIVAGDWGRRYETEGQYLQRLGLLTQRERQLLAKSA